MLLRELGGEFAMIERIARQQITDPAVVKGIGDDCAVVRYREDRHLLVTTDMMVEHDHFNILWSTPAQIAMKLMESNVSDIIAMGGTPKFAFISMSLKKDTTVEFIDGFYDGLYASAATHGVALLGGDTTHGTEYVFSLTLLGEVHPELMRLRSNAREGDCIAVTGTLGGSTAGLKLLLRGKEGFLKDHLEPKSRTVTEGALIARYANAMIDVSDGLASEVKHIARASNLGARIARDTIPLSPSTIASATSLDLDPYDFALYGGEDFQLVFTIPHNDIQALKGRFRDFTVVGEMVPKSEGIFLIKDNCKEALKKAYDHFA